MNNGELENSDNNENSEDIIPPEVNTSEEPQTEPEEASTVPPAEPEPDQASPVPTAETPENWPSLRTRIGQPLLIIGIIVTLVFIMAYGMLQSLRGVPSENFDFAIRCSSSDELHPENENAHISCYPYPVFNYPVIAP